MAVHKLHRKATVATKANRRLHLAWPLEPIFDAISQERDAELRKLVAYRHADPEFLMRVYERIEKRYWWKVYKLLYWSMASVVILAGVLFCLLCWSVLIYLGEMG